MAHNNVIYLETSIPATQNTDMQERGRGETNDIQEHDGAMREDPEDKASGEDMPLWRQVKQGDRMSPEKLLPRKSRRYEAPSSFGLWQAVGKGKSVPHASHHRPKVKHDNLIISYIESVLAVTHVERTSWQSVT